MRLIYPPFLLVACLYYLPSVHAQTVESPTKESDVSNLFHEEEDIRSLFDDNGLQNARLTIKTQILSPLQGDWHFMLEYKVLNRITLEGGLGRVNNYGLAGTITNGLWGIQPVSNSPAQLGYSAAAKFYTSRSFEGLFYGAHIRMRPYASARTRDYFISTGWQGYLDKHITISLTIGMGIKNVEYYHQDPLFRETESYMIVPFQVALGYTF